MNTNKEYLTRGQRWSNLVVVVIMMLLGFFFERHQFSNTGFFTEEFGVVEMLALYGPIYLAVVAPIVRAVGGRKNPARPWEALANLALAAGAFWLWRTFPFDFRHLGDAFPEIMQPPFQYITDDIGRVILMVQIILGPITALVNLLRYLAVKRRMPVG